MRVQCHYRPVFSRDKNYFIRKLNHLKLILNILSFLFYDLHVFIHCIYFYSWNINIITQVCIMIHYTSHDGMVLALLILAVCRTHVILYSKPTLSIILPTVTHHESLVAQSLEHLTSVWKVIGPNPGGTQIFSLSHACKIMNITSFLFHYWA